MDLEPNGIGAQFERLDEAIKQMIGSEAVGRFPGLPRILTTAISEVGMHLGGIVDPDIGGDMTPEGLEAYYGLPDGFMDWLLWGVPDDPDLVTGPASALLQFTSDLLGWMAEHERMLEAADLEAEDDEGQEG